MWLPTPIYERTPQLWMLMAVLFVVLGLYIGFAYKLTIFYLALGLFCAGRGFHVLRMRRNYRREKCVEAEPGADSAVEAAGN
jgi:hypothetical protein